MKLIERLVNAYAPYCCVVCGSEGKALCDWCLPDAVTERPSVCYRCDSPTRDYRTCAVCEVTTPIAAAWIVAEYSGAVKQLIRGLKYDRRRGYASVLARLMDDTLPYFSESPLVMHVPTASSRRRQRGFDQAELLASALARKRGWLRVSGVRRLDQNRQVGHSRRERLANELRFDVNGRFAGKELILVDDVISTGRSVEQAAHALVAAGARTVRAVAVAGNRASQHP